LFDGVVFRPTLPFRPGNARPGLTLHGW
jgi:hypothetical protein